MEQLDYSLLFRWFVGLSMDVRVWDATVYPKYRDRLVAGDVAARLLQPAQQATAAAGTGPDKGQKGLSPEAVAALREAVAGRCAGPSGPNSSLIRSPSP